MHSAGTKWTALALALVLLLSWFPRGVLAQETENKKQIVDLSQLVSGQYILLSSDGTSPGCLEEGWLAGAGLDTLDQEPVSAEHPLVALPPELQSRVVLSPHISGVTTAFYRRGHLNMWQNIAKVAAGQRPDTIVNAL